MSANTDLSINWSNSGTIQDAYLSRVELPKMTLRVYCSICENEIGESKCYVRLYLSENSSIFNLTTNQLMYMCSDECLAIYDLRKG